MTYDEAMEMAMAEFDRFNDLVNNMLNNRPDLTHSEVLEQVEYEHPTFLIAEDQAMYDKAAVIVALGAIVSSM